MRFTAPVVLTISIVAAPSGNATPSETLTALGQPSFDERFATFDHGADQQRPQRPHRWRTVYGYGGAHALSNRQMSGPSFASDAWFSGMGARGPGKTPLGLNPFIHSAGQLVIMGRPVPRALRPLVWSKPYYGGAITTKFSFNQKFGYFEIEARLPAGRGMWPAFWIMPVQGNWPASGEIDVFEGLGDPHRIYCTVIAGKDRRQLQVPLAFDASASFHRYGVLWGPREIAWYVDRRLVGKATTPAVLTRSEGYLIANLAVGGSWGGMPDAATRFPGRYAIRRITVWPLRR